MSDDLFTVANVASNVMKVVETAAVITANIIAPGSGSLVKEGFKLAKVCIQIGQVLAGMEKTAGTIQTQFKNIQEDVEEFKYTLNLLSDRVQNQTKLTEGLQETILRFEKEVNQYSDVVNKFSNMNMLKQLTFRSRVSEVSANAMRTKEKLEKRLTMECAIDGSSNYSREHDPSVPKRSSRTLDQVLEEREKEYMQLVDSPEVIQEMSDPQNQKEMLAIISHISRRNEAMLQSKQASRDRVVNVMKEKLWATSTAAIRDEVSKLPDWYITEGEVDIDKTAVLGFGGDANIYKGLLYGEALVAIKIFNADVNRSEEAKQKFISTMRLWERLSHENICRLHGACYLTATPFIVMEHCEHGPLDKFLRQDEPNRYKFSLEILAQAAQALHKMHSIGIVHGDLKCDNILVTGANRQAKICDFDRSFDWISLKNKRLVNGTAAQAGVELTDALRYLAPECVEGLVPNSKTDVYSFGMTLFHALVGETPYADISSNDELRTCKLDRELPTRDYELINDDAWDLFNQCCHRNPEQRPPMEKIAKALRALSNQQQETKPTPLTYFANKVAPAPLPVAEVVSSSTISSSSPRQNLPNQVFPAPVEEKPAGLIAVVEPQAPQTKPDQLTPVKLLTNKPRRGGARSWKLLLLAVAVSIICAGIAVIAILAFVGVEPFASWKASITRTSTSTSASTPTPTPTPVATPTPTPIPSRTSKPTPTPTMRSNSSSTQNSTGTDTITAPTTLYVRVSTIAGYGSVFSISLGDAWYRYGLAVAANGSIYVSADHHILRLSDSMDLSVYAGGVNYGFQNGPRTNATFDEPRGLAMRNSTGNLFVCDFGNSVVRQIASDGTVSNLSSFTSTDLRGAAVDLSGNVFVSDYSSATITKISSDGTGNTTFAANISTTSMAIDASDNVYVIDRNAVRMFTPTGTSSILAGAVATRGFLDAAAEAARFSIPTSLTIGSDGDLYVADTSNHCIRKISLNTTVVTTHAGICGQYGSADGFGSNATFYKPMAIAAAANRKLFVVDGFSTMQRVRKIYWG